jgi:hypothetical protein
MMEGFATFKTSSMTRQEATSDHTSSIKVPEPRVDFQAALKKAKTVLYNDKKQTTQCTQLFTSPTQNTNKN